MKKILIALAVLVVVALGAVIALPFFIDVNAYKPTIEAKAKEALGRELKLNGPIKLALWPEIGIEASDIRVANMPGGQAKEMASLKSLLISAELWPLLSRQLNIKRFVLNDLTVNVEVDRNGRSNLQFGPDRPAPKPAAAGAPPSAAVSLGEMKLNNVKIGYSNLQTGDKLALEPFTATANLTLDARGAKPAVNGKLSVDKLAVISDPGAAPAPAAKPAADWPNDPIDLSVLKTFDADLTASADEVKYNKIKAGKSTVKLAVKDGRAAIDLAVPKPGLYQGEGTVNLVVNAAQTPAAYDVKAKLAGLQAQPFLVDATEMEKLSGVLNADASVTGRGASQRQIVQALNGNGSVKFNDGAIKGIDLGGVARQLGEVGKGAGTFDATRLKTGFGNLWGGAGASEKTDFGELTGTFKIVNGLLSNEDLLLKSPFVRVTGKGTVSLPPRTMDYTVLISAVATAQGQGGGDAGGVGIPVHCKGAWSGDNCNPDIAGMFMGDPTKLLKAMPGLGGAALPGVGGGALPGMGAGKPAIPGAGGALPGGGSLPGAGGLPGLGGSSTTAPAATTPAPAAPAPATGGTRLPGGLPGGGFKLPGQ